MKSISLLSLAAISFLAIGSGQAHAQNPPELFQQALRKEQLDGDLDAAISLYRRILASGTADRALQAKTLLRLGGAYEKLGSAQARAAYRRVVREFPDQVTEAATAQARLATLETSKAIAQSTEPTVHRIWSGDSVDVLGAPTPDGRILTFVDWSTGDLAFRDLLTGENRRVTNKGPWSKSVEFALWSVPSPEGKRVAFEWYDSTERSALRIADLDGGNVRTLYSSAAKMEDVDPVGWTPDGRNVVAYIAKSASSEIVVIGANDGAVRHVLDLDWMWPDRIKLSPDGRFIAFDYPVGRTVTQHDVFVVPTAGGPAIHVVGHPAYDEVVGWDPAGNGLLFASDRTGTNAIWFQPLRDGIPAGEPRLVRRDVESTILPLGVTKAGTLLYGANPSPIDIYEATLDRKTGKVMGRPVRLLDRNPGANRSADWSPDGRRIVYRGSRRLELTIGAPELAITTPSGSDVTLVPTKLTILGPPRWSPDGAYIVVRAKDSTGAAGLFRVDPISGASRLLFSLRTTDIGWSEDGNSTISIQRNFAQGTFAILSVPIDGGTPHELYRITSVANHRGNLSGGAVSPARNKIAFVEVSWMSDGAAEMERSTLKVMAASGGEPREIYRAPESRELRSVAWSADGRYVLFALNRLTSDARGHINTYLDSEPMMRVPVNGGPAEEMGATADDIRDIRASPDGTRLLFTAGQNAWDVWAMENFLPRRSRTPAVSK